MSHRFIVIPPDALEIGLRRALLAEFVTREGYDTTDTHQGVDLWVSQLEARITKGELLIVHDLQTQMSEVMSPEQFETFQRS